MHTMPCHISYIYIAILAINIITFIIDLDKNPKFLSKIELNIFNIVWDR